MASTDPYHHGNLRAALLDAAFAAVARGGPSALVVRDLARIVGVSPAAAYHHFQDRDHLLAAVAQRAREAMATRMAAARQSVPSRLALAVRAKRRLAAVGQAYLDFAFEEPELVRVAFTPCAVMPDNPDDPGAWETLVTVLDELEQTGVIDPSRRLGAEVIVWSAVHGLSVLRNDGAVPPAIPRADLDQTIIDGILAALGCAPAGGTAGRVARRSRENTAQLLPK